MSLVETSQALKKITDAGLFERLATAVLRESSEEYRSLLHLGVNADGKTVRSPVDGICFSQQESAKPHLIAVHHTIASRERLRDKWLHDPATVKPRKGSSAKAPAGDLIKTVEIVTQERNRTPGLNATLILTTNVEPIEGLFREVNATARKHGIKIDLWSCSRLSHFLDHTPSGQWLRYSYLGIEQEQLSSELLSQLSRESLDVRKPLDNPAAWVARAVDDKLKKSLARDVTFLVGRSGSGKSVACYRKLRTHVEGGGYGLILPHTAIEASSTLEQAVMRTLQQLHPSLSITTRTATSYCSTQRPLLLVVEDINRSGQTQRLLEKIASWGCMDTDERRGGLSRWRILCPVWPEAVSSSSEQVQRCIGPMLTTTEGFTKQEGCNAVMTRAKLVGHEMSQLKAESISLALGHDPLLIALYDSTIMPNASGVIGAFITRALQRVSNEQQDYLYEDYRQALHTFGEKMLSERQVEPSWREITAWMRRQSDLLRGFRHLVKKGELFRQENASSGQQFAFRHDRVRDWILADTILYLQEEELLSDQVISEPYFSGVIGIALAQRSNPALLQRTASSNSLALFYALRSFGEAKEPHHIDILREIFNFLDKSTTHERASLHLRRKALLVLSETDSSEVPHIAKALKEQTIESSLARLRNGELWGGILLCNLVEPGIDAPWRDRQIEHAKLQHGASLTEELSRLLSESQLEQAVLISALRLAGHLAEPRLAVPIETYWSNDVQREEYLDEYLWAFGRCCADDPERFLSPVCDEWAALSDEKTDFGSSPRNSLAAYELRFAFMRWPPSAAITYFVERGAQDDLRWPITYMLYGIDHPEAVLFVVREFSLYQKQAKRTGTFWHHKIDRVWENAQKAGRPMSENSRNVLLELWQNSNNDQDQRFHAFQFWARTQYLDDIEFLHAVDSSDKLAEDVLEQRLMRGDRLAIPAMIEKLKVDEKGYWLQYGRYIWSSDLTKALGSLLEKRRAESKQVWNQHLPTDWIVYELIMRLPMTEAERILLSHWDHLRFVDYFVQTALYIATPNTVEIAKTSISEHPNPSKLMQFLAMHYGIRTTNHPGIDRRAQILALSPYLHLLSSSDIRQLWEECNEHEWFDIRRELLDHLLDEQSSQRLKWEKEKAFLELDKMSKKNQGFQLDIWIEDYLKTDIEWQEILSTMQEWLDKRKSFEAFKILSTAISYRGSRTDLDMLRAYRTSFVPNAEQITQDIEFDVSLRSLH